MNGGDKVSHFGYTISCQGGRVALTVVTNFAYCHCCNLKFVSPQEVHDWPGAPSSVNISVFEEPCWLHFCEHTLTLAKHKTSRQKRHRLKPYLVLSLVLFFSLVSLLNDIHIVGMKKDRCLGKKFCCSERSFLSLSGEWGDICICGTLNEIKSIPMVLSKKGRGRRGWDYFFYIYSDQKLDILQCCYTVASVACAHCMCNCT